MNKQKLYDLEIKHKELRQLLERIESVEIYPSTELTGTPRGCVISDKTSVAACVLVDYKNHLSELLVDIQKLRGEIINELSGLDAVTYDILYLRLVSGMAWRQVAIEVGSTEEAVRQAYSRLKNK